MLMVIDVPQSHRLPVVKWKPVWVHDEHTWECDIMQMHKVHDNFGLATEFVCVALVPIWNDNVTVSKLRLYRDKS